MGQEELERRLKVLRGSRTGKKSSITKRINQLHKYVEDKQGRRATELLLEFLQKVYGELEKVCEEISELSEEYDSKNDLEDVRFEVDSCAATVAEYLEATRDDPASSNSSIALSWVKKHAKRFGGGYEEDGSVGGKGSEDGTADAGQTQVSHLQKVQNLGRFTYSDSRPATPRTLPSIPISRVCLDKPVLALGDAAATLESPLDRSISDQLKELHIDGEGDSADQENRSVANGAVGDEKIPRKLASGQHSLMGKETL